MCEKQMQGVIGVAIAMLGKKAGGFRILFTVAQINHLTLDHPEGSREVHASMGAP